MKANPSCQIFKPFRYKTLKDLKTELKNLMIPLALKTKTKNLKNNIQVDQKVIANRLAIQPMEGFDADLIGNPSELTFRRYKRFAQGGVGLIWFEATAISKNCRSNDHQLVLSEETLNSFKKLTTLTRNQCNDTLKSLGFKDSCCLILQLNHSGRYTKIEGKKYPIRAYHNEKFDDALQVKNDQGIIISDDEIKEIEDLWIKKAILAKEAGFDAVDIKACHGYLVSELLSAHTRQDSIYGGKSLENRSRLLMNIINTLQDTFRKDNDYMITSRLGVYDGNPYPYGFGVKMDENEVFPASADLREPIDLLNNIYKQGIRLINISAGNPHYRPHITRPYDVPIKDGTIPKEHPLFSAYRIAYLTSLVRKLIPQDLVIIGSGYSYFRQFAGNISSALVEKNMVDICGFGRMALANPEFAKQIFLQNGIQKKESCITCSKCSQFMKEGKSTGCAIRDPIYKEK